MIPFFKFSSSILRERRFVEFVLLLYDLRQQCMCNTYEGIVKMIVSSNKFVTLAVLCVVFLSGCIVHKKNTFHSDLLHQASPLHPSCVLATQFGDSSRFDPQPIVSLFADGAQSQDQGHIMCDYQNGKVTFENTYRLTYGPNDVSPEYTICDEYEYIASYKDKHIILSGSYDTSGTGRFAFLGVIRRSGDTIQNAGEIAAGDRGHGGIIRVLSHNENILRYASCETIDNVIHVLTSKSIDESYPPPAISGFSPIYEVNLDEPIENDVYTSKLVGLWLDFEKYHAYRCICADDKHCCAYDVANGLLEKGKRELTLSEARQFGKQLYDCMMQNNN